MRLWHKDLIPVLPNKQLIGQWRECCAISRNIAMKGTPNHLLVNKVLEYPIGDFWMYSIEVYNELLNRGYECNYKKFSDKFESNFEANYAIELPAHIAMFIGWHNDRYLKQCFYNLQEKYDCGGMSLDEYTNILNKVLERIDI